MKIVRLSFLIFLLMIVGCSKNSNPTESDHYSYSYEFTSQFNSPENPQSFIIDDENQFIYIQSGQTHSISDNLKIQQYSFEGNLLNTVINFSNYSFGLYEKYSPIDLSIDEDNNICVLAKSYKKTDGTDYWESYDGFTILIHDKTGNFIEELDFTNISLEINPEVITFKDGFFYVTNSFSLFKISKLTQELTEIFLPKNEDNAFPKNLISDLAINGDNDIWFVGQTTETLPSNYVTPTNYIAKMDFNGNELLKFYSVNTTPILHAAISEPAIILSEDNVIYITTFSCRSFEIYDSNGKNLYEYDLANEIDENILPIDIEIDNSKRIFILDNWNAKVYILKQKEV